MNKDFWRGKRVLITGHTGFKGSWLTAWLHATGAMVTGYALAPSTKRSLFGSIDQGLNISSIIADVRDAERLADVVRKGNFDIVFHLAAQSLVIESYRAPLETFDVNVMGTANVLDSLRETNVRACVVITTDKCYENKKWVWPYRESDELGGHDPYSSSKACAELVTSSFRRSFFAAHQPQTRIATARAGNVIGGGDWSENRLIPDIVRAERSNTVLEIRGPNSVRPWQHVLDPLDGYLRLAETLYSESQCEHEFNFGPDASHEQPVGRIVSHAVQRFPKLQVRQVVSELHEATYLTLDSSRARARLGWRGVLDVETALAWTFDWYAKEANEHSALELCYADIKRYESL